MSSGLSAPAAVASPHLPNAFSVDVEDYFQVGVFQSRLSQDEWQGFESRVERNVDRCLELLEAGKARATFFFLGWVAERSPALVRRVLERGHEIGSHGHRHQPIWTLDPTAFREDLKRSNDAIAAAAGSPPTIYRAPCFSVTQKTLWALDILHEQGFRRDSSIFPVPHPEYGIPGAEPAMHRIGLPSGGEIEEFPMTVGRLLGKKLAFCGGGWFRLFPYAITRRKLAQAAREGQPFVFYLHPWEIDPDQPRIRGRASLTGRLRHYLNLRRTEPRLERLLGEFRFDSLGAVMDQVIARKGGLPLVRYTA